MRRRNFLTFGIGEKTDARPVQNGVATLGNARRTLAGLEPFVPSTENPWNYRKAAHLLQRTMVGARETEIRQALADGVDATVAKLLTGFTPDLGVISTWAGHEPQVRSKNSDQSSAEYIQWLQTLFQRRDDIAKWWLTTISTAPVSIQERMTLFWHNHFANEIDVVNFAEYMFVQNRLLRQNFLGNFRQMVKDITVDVAMLIYLDGRQNYKTGNRGGINENYGRELMELFTLGVTDWNGNPNYTQQDVSEAARALSGYVIAPSTEHPGDTYFGGIASVFVQTRWDSGSKTFLGKTGAWKAMDVVDIIFSEKGDQVAKFICEKIYRAFVYDIPDHTIITEMAKTFKNSNWEIRPVMEQLLKSAHFFDETNIGAMDKSPTDYMIGMIRGLGLSAVPDFTAGTPPRFSRDLSQRLISLGQIVFSPPNVKGWPGGRTWVSTSTAPLRQSFALNVMDAKIKGTGSPAPTYYIFDPIAFAKTFADYDDIQKLSANMANYLLNVNPSSKESEMLYQTILDGGKPYEWKIDDPTQKAGERIRKFLKAAAQLAKFQLY